jgi:hypothetical protein
MIFNAQKGVLSRRNSVSNSLKPQLILTQGSEPTTPRGDGSFGCLRRLDRGVGFLTICKHSMLSISMAHWKEAGRANLSWDHKETFQRDPIATRRIIKKGAEIGKGPSHYA